MEKKKAIISGLGQDTLYLARLLLDKNYEVYATTRNLKSKNTDHFKDFNLSDVKILEIDYSDFTATNNLIKDIAPDEFYNLSGVSSVGYSFQNPVETLEANGKSVINILESIRKSSNFTKFYQAGSTEEFGGVSVVSDPDEVKLQPKSPYAASKVFAHNMCDIYRNAYGLFACNGVLSNHESEYRSKEFVTRKITDWVGQYVNGIYNGPLELGNLEVKRDWGHSKDFCNAMWLILQQQQPKNYLISTGETHALQDFLEYAFIHAGIYFRRTGNGVDIKYYDIENNKLLVQVNPSLYRPVEINNCWLDSSKTQKELQWKPEIMFDKLVEKMVLSDINKYKIRK